MDRRDGCIFQTETQTPHSACFAIGKWFSSACFEVDKLTIHYSPLFDALGTFPDGIAQHSTLSAGKTWQGEQRVIRFGLLGGVPWITEAGRADVLCVI